MLTAASMLFGITAGIICSFVLLFGYKHKPVPMAIGLIAVGCIPGTPFVPAALSFAFADGSWAQALWGAFNTARQRMMLDFYLLHSVIIHPFPEGRAGIVNCRGSDPRTGLWQEYGRDGI